MSAKKGASLEIRNAANEHVDGIRELGHRVYPFFEPYAHDTLRAQILNFSQGQFVALFDGKIVGYCSTIRVPESKALTKHTWTEITANGYGSTHDPQGDWLYGIEIFVDSDYRGLKIGDRFYKERRNLCKMLRLKGIAFGSRMPLMQKWFPKLSSPEEYLDLVQQKKIKDPVLNLQIRNGFEPIGILPKYLPGDIETKGYAAHMIWRNPEVQTYEKSNKTYGARLAVHLPKTSF